MLLRIVFTALIMMTFTTYCVVCQSGADVNDLLTRLYLTDDYNVNVRPIKNQSNPVVITLEYVLNSVIEFNDQEESLKTAGYLYVSWTDEYLAWNVSDYNGVKQIHLPQANIWKPDLSLRNPYKTFSGLGSSYLYLRVENDGTVHWSPFQILESTCSVNIKYFPWDSQECDLKFTAWSYSKDEVEINIGRNAVALSDFVPNAAWDLTGSSYREVNTDEAAIIFTLQFTRKSSFYVINIIAPVVLLSVLNACTFILPIQSGEKASFGVTVFLSLAVFLTIVASELPKNSDTISLMSIYLFLMSALSTGIVVLSLIELRLSTRDASEIPVSGLYSVLINIERTLRCQKCKKSASVHPTVKVVEVKKSTLEKGEDVLDRVEYNWTDVVNAIDFVAFWFSVFITCLCTVVIFLECAAQGRS